MPTAPASLRNQGTPWPALDTWVNQISLTPDGKILAAACIDRSIRLWDVDSQKPLGALKGHTNTVRCLAVRSDGNLIYSGADEGTIKVWDLNSSTCVDTWPGHKGAVRTIAMSPDGKWLASGGDDGTVRLWDLVERKQLEVPVFKHVKPVASICFSEKGTYLASGDESGCLAVWTYQNGLQPYTQLKGPLGSLTGLASIPGTDEVLSSSSDRSMTRWNLAFRSIVGSPIKAHSDSAQCIKVSADGMLAFSGGTDSMVYAYDVAGNQPIGEPWKGVETSVETMALCSEKSLLITAGTSEIWSWTYAAE